MADSTKLSIEEMLARGIKIQCKDMNGGELRTRLSSCGHDVTITQLSEDSEPKWQEAHFHKGISETYFVAAGKILMVFEKNGRKRHMVMKEGDVITFYPHEPHTLQLFPGVVFHTMKSGTSIGNPDRNGNDWFPAPEFEAWVDDARREEKFSEPC
jgi:mannose-6-phosphate isomerase-like protein (cupin superfamily)